MARNSIGSRKSQLQQAAKDCVGLLLVIVVAVIKLARALIVLLLSALMLAGAAAATGAVGRLAGTQRASEQQHTPAACQQGAEAVDDAAVPESPLSPPPTPIDLAAAAAAAAATTPSPASVVELLDSDRPRLLNRVPSGTHRAKRAPDVITPGTVGLRGLGWGCRLRKCCGRLAAHKCCPRLFSRCGSQIEAGF